MMQKLYKITGDLDTVRAWAARPENHSVLIGETEAGETHWSLVVTDQLGMPSNCDRADQELADHCQVMAWPE